MKELDNSIIILALTLCKEALIATFLVGLITHFSVLKRYFFDNQGLAIRLIWVLGTAILAGYYGENHTSFLTLQSQVILLLVPVCCLINICFCLTTILIPEVSYFFQFKKIQKWIRTAEIRNAVTNTDGKIETPRPPFLRPKPGHRQNGKKEDDERHH